MLLSRVLDTIMEVRIQWRTEMLLVTECLLALKQDYACARVFICVAGWVALLFIWLIIWFSQPKSWPIHRIHVCCNGGYNSYYGHQLEENDRGAQWKT